MRFYLLLLLAYCKLSLAFGIGDIAVKSHLGEYFAATINVTDVEKSPDTSCFSVTDIGEPPAFKKASLTIKPGADGYQLIISTHEAITEPVVNLHVTYHCDPVINRDYVVLLDPPSANPAKTDIENTAAANDNAGQNKYSASVNAESKTNINRPSTNSAVKNKSSRRKKADMSASIDDRLAAAYTGSPQVTAQATTAKKNKSPPADNHYLTISGGNIPSYEKTALPKPALRLDTEIDLAREEQLAPLSNTDLMDEVTVMDNRLDHLEKQIASLQNTNAKLKKDAQNATRKLEDSMQHLRLAAGSIALLAFIEWLRRKLVRARLKKVENHWFGDEHLTNLDDTAESATNNANANSGDARKSIFNDPFFGNSLAEKSAGFAVTEENSSNDTTINSNASADILESADVFIEHGRPSLAIQLLQDYLIDYPAESPKIWLRLLSLLAANGPEAEYTQALADCSHYYHIKMPDFAEAKKPDHSSIEDFHKISEKLEDAWKSGTAGELLKNLIYDRQAQPMEGFGPQAFEELFLLEKIAEIIAANPDILNEDINKPATVNAPEALALPTQLDDAKTREAENTALNTFIRNAQFQDLQSYEVSSIENFDELNSLDERFNPEYGNQLLPAISIPEPAESNALPKILPVLQAAEIDFPPQMDEIADAKNAVSGHAENNTLPVIASKPPKKIFKDSNLIDWDLTDDA